MQPAPPRRAMAIIGADSAVGAELLALLAAHSWDITAFTRNPHAATGACASLANTSWKHLPSQPPSTGFDAGAVAGPAIATWVCLDRAEHLPPLLPLLEAAGARRLVALSSTSLLTKAGSSDTAERALAATLAQAEADIAAWAARHGVTWTILRPTLAYGGGRDRNITAMAGVIRRLGFFPLLGAAGGLRQPVHIADIADAVHRCLDAPSTADRAYNIGGGEVLSYRDMTARVFAALGRQPRLVTIPPAVIKSGIRIARLLPRFRDWSPEMAERMQADMAFDCSEAARDFGYTPRPFRPTSADVTPPIG